MPRQQRFLTKRIGAARVEVIKTYDQSLAREAFGDMTTEAQTSLWAYLNVDANYDRSDLPKSEDREDFLWDELLESAREDWNSDSFFIVTEKQGREIRNLYVTSGWPDAEAFVSRMLVAA